MGEGRGEGAGRLERALRNIRKEAFGATEIQGASDEKDRRSYGAEHDPIPRHRFGAQQGGSEALNDSDHRVQGVDGPDLGRDD